MYLLRSNPNSNSYVLKCGAEGSASDEDYDQHKEVDARRHGWDIRCHAVARITIINQSSGENVGKYLTAVETIGHKSIVVALEQHVGTTNNCSIVLFSDDHLQTLRTDGEATVKRNEASEVTTLCIANNENYSMIALSDDNAVQIWENAYRQWNHAVSQLPQTNITVHFEVTVDKDVDVRNVQLDRLLTRIANMWSGEINNAGKSVGIYAKCGAYIEGTPAHVFHLCDSNKLTIYTAENTTNRTLNDLAGTLANDIYIEALDVLGQSTKYHAMRTLPADEDSDDARALARIALRKWMCFDYRDFEPQKSYRDNYKILGCQYTITHTTTQNDNGNLVVSGAITNNQDNQKIDYRWELVHTPYHIDWNNTTFRTIPPINCANGQWEATVSIDRNEPKRVIYNPVPIANKVYFKIYDCALDSTMIPDRIGGGMHGLRLYKMRSNDQEEKTVCGIFDVFDNYTGVVVMIKFTGVRQSQAVFTLNWALKNDMLAKEAIKQDNMNRAQQRKFENNEEQRRYADVVLKDIVSSNSSQSSDDSQSGNTLAILGLKGHSNPGSGNNPTSGFQGQSQIHAKPSANTKKTGNMKNAQNSGNSYMLREHQRDNSLGMQAELRNKNIYMLGNVSVTIVVKNDQQLPVGLLDGAVYSCIKDNPNLISFISGWGAVPPVLEFERGSARFKFEPRINECIQGKRYVADRVNDDQHRYILEISVLNADEVPLVNIQPKPHANTVSPGSQYQQYVNNTGLAKISRSPAPINKMKGMFTNSTKANPGVTFTTPSMPDNTRNSQGDNIKDIRYTLRSTDELVDNDDYDQVRNGIERMLAINPNNSTMMTSEPTPAETIPNNDYVPQFTQIFPSYTIDGETTAETVIMAEDFAHKIAVLKAKGSVMNSGEHFTFVVHLSTQRYVIDIKNWVSDGLVQGIVDAVIRACQDVKSHKVLVQLFNSEYRIRVCKIVGVYGTIAEFSVRAASEGAPDWVVAWGQFDFDRLYPGSVSQTYEIEFEAVKKSERIPGIHTKIFRYKTHDFIGMRDITVTVELEGDMCILETITARDISILLSKLPGHCYADCSPADINAKLQTEPVVINLDAHDRMRGDPYQTTYYTFTISNKRQRQIGRGELKATSSTEIKPTSPHLDTLNEVWEFLKSQWYGKPPT